MTTTFGRDVPEAPGSGAAAPRDFDEERSIRAALRITLLFLAVVILLLWAGVADAGGGPAANPERAIESTPDPRAVSSSLPCGRS